ncbi:chitin synthase-domain-containing protein [Radiomyces spectabilis]|uniref:chitin synthase-domain-containing protein n=1 Tax=Radiomyces spectabilis TaxID=64574 RepID=UPI00222111EA|nr:chitin synthase-domain-containing protein [Radiomyces spectabilis]KAI8393502.1 chitin synthase-domain-containing protein [Radiomyces spectabilis]
MSNPNRVSGYTPALRGLGPDQRGVPANRQNYHAHPQRPPTQRFSQSPAYGMDNLPRPRPPPHRQPYPGQSANSPHRGLPRSQDSRDSRDSAPQSSFHYPPQHQSRQSYAQRPMPGATSSAGPAGGRPMMRPPVSYNAQIRPGGHGAYRRSSMNRSRSLSRPERQRPRQGMIRSPSQQRAMANRYPMQPGTQNPMMMQGRPRPNQPMSNRLQQQLQQQKLHQQQEALLDQAPLQANRAQEELIDEEKPKVLTSWWAWIAFLATCCIPNWFIRVCFRKPNAMMQQAWREKLTLVYMILLLCGALTFITYGLNRTLCPSTHTNYPYSQKVNGQRTPVWRQDVRVFGQLYPLDKMKDFFSAKGLNLTNDYENMDISSIFDGDTTGSCTRFDTGGGVSTLGACRVNSPYGGSISTTDGKCLSVSELRSFYHSTVTLGFDWADLRPKGVDALGDTDLVVLGDSVLNLTRYFNSNNKFFGDDVDRVLHASRGNDLSYALLYNRAGKEARRCLSSRYTVGIMETEAAGCIASQIIMTVMLSVIIAMIVVRYAMALMFQWFIARRLVKPGGRSNWLAWRSIKGGNEDPANHVPGPYNNYGPMNVARGSNTSLTSGSSSRGTPLSEHNSAVELGGPRSDIVTTELYTVMLVTCYSEGEEGLRTTMDSLAETTYSKKHKIFFVIADGMITGAGETKSTPDIVVSMMDLDPTMSNPKASSYLAIADGEKQLNMAKVYAGHYKGVPCITIVKCGTEEETDAPKAGNRGKRDSQLILMSFFQRVLFNDRLSELDYEIFWKMTWLMKGVTPDKFELVLMVDADTKVLPEAITYMVAAMANDITIMGLCGETRIANKRASWVTAIQVFEYYISHHYAKAFESLFGIVTCLPGCFSMYRIKTPKNGAWVPILANPDIILEYNQNIVTTLHAKNLLLLGEDRFLSTLMLRTFPKRQMMFVPQARCRTVVPDEFKVLLSQRRRWINSTVHNLMELVLVSDLCGIACLSMQFSVFVDLIGTLVLPAAICLTIYLIIDTAISSNPQWQSLALLLAILGLPAVLIAVTTLKFVYILWMCVYIIALPIWNFILPVYSFWHFDDFSWGATRVVAGEKKDKGHGDAEGKFDSSRLVMKKWEDWEAERTGQRINKNKLALKTPLDPPAFDGSNKGTITPATAPFGTIFNDRKMFGHSPASTIKAPSSVSS